MTYPTSEDTGEILTLTEVAQILKMHRNSVSRHMEAGKLPGVKIGKLWRVSRATLLHFLDTGEVTYPAAANRQ